MNSLKQATIEVIKRLPDSCSVEEIMYEINLTAQVLQGLKDEEKGKTVSTEELLNRISKWQRK